MRAEMLARTLRNIGATAFLVCMASAFFASPGVLAEEGVNSLRALAIVLAWLFTIVSAVAWAIVFLDDSRERRKLWLLLPPIYSVYWTKI